MEYVLLAGAIIGFIISMRIRRKEKKAKKEANQLLEKKKQTLNCLEHGTFNHTVGLPVAENAICNVFYCEDKIVIESSGTTFNLPIKRITDISITSNVEIQNAYVSSIGGAVGGAVLFGPLGAMIGGRSKKKETKTVTPYIVFTYLKEDELQYIAFNVTGARAEANKFVKRFKELAATNQSTQVHEITL